MFIKGANDVLCALDVSFGVNPVVGYEDVLAYKHDVLVQESKNDYILHPTSNTHLSKGFYYMYFKKKLLHTCFFCKNNHLNFGQK